MGQKGVVVLGVTGGIAAYKAADLVSKLKKDGYDVHVILTRHGREFITETTFQSLSQNPVYMDMFEIGQWNTEHISIAKRADIFVIAPATANIIGKVSTGIADDLLSTTIMATKAPVLFAPAMNTNMYENLIVQRNIASLKALGYYFMEPNEGRLACGDVGKGKMSEPMEILAEIQKILGEKKEQRLKGKKALVTAGPTREPLDPFRFITNYSSGKMGYALAQALRDEGAEVILITGPTNLPRPVGVEIICIETAQEMYQRVLAHFEHVDVVVKAAAVSDYKPVTYSEKKIKKTSLDRIELTKNPDILKELGQLKRHQVLVGFAAETENLKEYGQGKLSAKNLDLIVINQIGHKDTGFQGDSNIISLIDRDGSFEELPMLSKLNCAKIITEKIIEKMNQAT